MASGKSDELKGRVKEAAGAAIAARVDEHPGTLLVLSTHGRTGRRPRSGDDCDRTAITHVMACASHFPGELIGPS